MSQRIRILAPFLLFLAACTAPAPPVATPVTLSWPYATPEDELFPENREVARRALPAYVQLRILRAGPDFGGAGGGDDRTVVLASGIVVSRDGYIITAAHIARGTSFVAEVMTADGVVHPARILEVDDGSELALLQASGDVAWAPPPLAVPTTLTRGQPAFAIGSPGTTPGVVSVGSVRIPRRRNRLDYGRYGFDNGIELNLEIASGHSGGPVFDASGRLIGMSAGYLLGDSRQAVYVSPRIAFAVPADDIRAWLAARGVR